MSRNSEGIIEGIHPVIELLKSERSVDRIYISKSLRNSDNVNQIFDLARNRKISVIRTEKSFLDSNSMTGKHQGIIAYVSVHKYETLESIMDKTNSKDRFFIILDSIEDPYNLGAIIRTANCVGADAVIIPKNRAVGLTSSVSRASAGAIEHTPVVRVTNLVETIKYLQKNNVWIYGASLNTNQSYTECDFTGSIGLVIGSENSGMSKLVEQNCDFLIKIPMLGKIQSLNASVSTAIIAYEILQKRLQT